MIFRWFAPTSRESSIPCLYGAIVAQARRPAFYRLYHIPDTVMGRLEMIMLHLILVLRHFHQFEPQNRELGQKLFDHFCADMDANMREMGVGDLAVPRKMRRIGDAFYARQRLYGAAFARDTNEDLAEALSRHVYGSSAQAHTAARLADYSRRAAHDLLTQAGFERGEIQFPDPEDVYAPAQA
jgi:cytochrome b pre-mRNA-processing protein 3